MVLLLSFAQVIIRPFPSDLVRHSAYLAYSIGKERYLLEFQFIYLKELLL